MKILFGVFDWGLGHATRDIPLINELIKKHQVTIESTGRALVLLKDYYKDKCRYFDVPSLHSPYTKTPFFSTNFAFSLPKMLKSLSHARKITAQIIKDEKFDIVITDCRYDVYDTKENSFIINHQVRFKAPPAAETALEAWLASRMKKYKYVIVPDYDSPNLSGKLSHNLMFIRKEKIRYIGILSHLQKTDTEPDVDYFIPLSGPEPQRAILEKKILAETNRLQGKIVIAGGKPDENKNTSKENVEFYSFLNAGQQQHFMNRAKFIISRPGYTTVMELAELNKKDILFLPTPGQTEQEYLADFYEKNKYFHHVSQYRLSLNSDIERARDFSGFNPPWKTEQSIKNFMEIIEL